MSRSFRLLPWSALIEATRSPSITGMRASVEAPIASLPSRLTSGCVIVLRRQHPLQYRIVSYGNVPNRGEAIERASQENPELRNASRTISANYCVHRLNPQA